MEDINKVRVVVLLAGFISMELEILGTRLISPIFGSTIHASPTIGSVSKGGLKFLTLKN